MGAPESKYWFFKNYFFFEGMSDEDYKSLEVQTEMLKCQKDQFVYLPGGDHDSVYFLKKGFLKLGMYEDGKEIVTEVLQPGEIFGNLFSYDEGGNPKEFAQAMSDVTVCQINIDKFRTMLANKPDMSLQVIKTVGERMMRLERKVASLAFRDARTRVVDFLKDFATDYGRVRGDTIHIDNFLTHQDIANLTATSRQLVSTVFNELRESGHIDYDRKNIEIRSPLETIA